MCEGFFRNLTEVCHRLLLDNNGLMHYLKSNRGITDESIAAYKLGAFPKDLRHLYEMYDLDPKELREQNIIWNADQSQFKLYPIVIPIRDIHETPIAIGCRTLFDEHKRKEMGIPKYRNSSYKKTFHLFGLDYAFSAIRKHNRVFVVEGYFDAIMAHQNGINNVVATCGTMFSDRQMMILSRYTDRVCLLFDNDKPGRTSAAKVMSKLDKTEDVNLTCEFTPQGHKDLDEYLRCGGNTNLFMEERIDFNDVEIKTLW